MFSNRCIQNTQKPITTLQPSAVFFYVFFVFFAVSLLLLPNILSPSVS